MSLAGLAAHLPEIWPAAELEPEHQGAVGHGVHIFALCQEEDTHGNEMFMVVFLSWMFYKSWISDWQYDGRPPPRGHLRYRSHKTP